MHSCEEAIAHIQQFYKVFESYRWVGEEMVIRIKKPLTSKSLTNLNEQFRDTLLKPEIEQSEIPPEEPDDRDWTVNPMFRSEHQSLARLVLTPKKTDFGTLRLLIDTINNSETED